MTSSIQIQEERRFLADRDRAARFVAMLPLRLEPEVRQPGRPYAFVRTTYLDTERWDLLGSSRDARVRRVRLREYAFASQPAAPPVFDDLAFLEHKLSVGRRRSKVRLQAHGEDWAELLESRFERPRSLARRLAELLAFRPLLPALRAGSLRPRLATWYRRTSFADADGTVRVTIDDALAACLPAAVGEPFGEGHVLLPQPGPVIEVKYAPPCPPWLSEALRGLREAPGFSKFRVGAVAVRSLAAGCVALSPAFVRSGRSRRTGP